jgi:hypothetical protein
MNVGTVVVVGLPRRYRRVHRLRPLQRIRRTRYIRLGWLFDHANFHCNINARAAC